MTNEQLSLLLVNLYSRLDEAIKSAEEELVGCDISRHTREVYIGKNPFPALSVIGKRKPDEWKTIDGSPIALDDLLSLSEALKQQAAILINNSEDT